MSLREKAQKAKDKPDQNGYVSQEMLDYWDASPPDVILELLNLLEEARKQIKHCTLTHRPHYFALEEIYGVWQEKRDFLARLNGKLSQ